MGPRWSSEADRRSAPAGRFGPHRCGVCWRREHLFPAPPWSPCGAWARPGSVSGDLTDQRAVFGAAVGVGQSWQPLTRRTPASTGSAKLLSVLSLPPAAPAADPRFGAALSAGAAGGDGINKHDDQHAGSVAFTLPTHRARLPGCLRSEPGSGTSFTPACPAMWPTNCSPVAATSFREADQHRWSAGWRRPVFPLDLHRWHRLPTCGGRFPAYRHWPRPYRVDSTPSFSARLSDGRNHEVGLGLTPTTAGRQRSCCSSAMRAAIGSAVAAQKYAERSAPPSMDKAWSRPWTDRSAAA